ncbi:type VI secretion system protein TssA [Sphingomonas sp. DG1-23]|uniref:type VI secretion system protein TssA n=1 Tax=Sphingomonas sp. DG1-23 TaxID=3068316 RepID=UPI0027402077|nr:type VI secretion system protein TssA [Sphingomonas sp. DG1-23]MDP5280602.1 type VI secretion system protein TssA [Sphingomonas sp. DG1-23]
MTEAVEDHDLAIDAGHPLAETVARLTAPISDSAPGGADLRHEGTYDAIDEARRNENARLPQGVWQREVKQADWAQVERLCVEALATRTKDLRIACWLAESWVRRFGFAGLAPGLALAEGLCRLFWDDLQPSIGGDPATHIAAIDWLNQRLPVALRQVPIVISAVAPDAQYTWSDYLDAQRLELIRGKDSAAAQRAEAGGSVTLKMIETCQDRTGSDHLNALATDAEAGLAALTRLDATLDACCGKDAPGLSNIRYLVDDIARFAGATVAARHALRLEPAPAVDTSVNPGAMQLDHLPTSAAMSRDLAYRQLAVIARFLRENEPHSPVPYVLENVASWGRMSLVELDEALRDQGSSVSLLIEALGMTSSDS